MARIPQTELNRVGYLASQGGEINNFFSFTYLLYLLICHNSVFNN